MNIQNFLENVSIVEDLVGSLTGIFAGALEDALQDEIDRETMTPEFATDLYNSVRAKYLSVMEDVDDGVNAIIDAELEAEASEPIPSDHALVPVETSTVEPTTGE